MKKILNVTGMSCMHCQNAVVKALKAVNGVDEVFVDLNTGKVTVECQPSVKSRQLVDAIAEAGYTVI